MSSNSSLTFPSKLDDFIIEELGGYDKHDFDKAAENINADVDRQKRNVGTYFPRSFIEVYAIFLDLMHNEYLKTLFKTKEEIFILDVGSGTGGNILGLLWFMNEFFDEFSNRKITVVSVDATPLSHP